MNNFDKRSIVRDQRLANLGLQRRVRLRIRSSTSTPQYNPDPTKDTRQIVDPNTDIIKFVTGTFVYDKEFERSESVGLYQSTKATIYFHPIFKSLVEQCYQMYIGGTNKEWKKISPPVFDSIRSSIIVNIEAVA